MKCNILRNNVTVNYIIDGKPQMIIPQNKVFLPLMGEILFLKDLDLLKNRSVSVLNIGLGAGYTTQEILKCKNVLELDVIEIFQEVIDKLNEFDTYESIISDSRCNIICSDAYEYVKNSEKKYDVIIMDICQPDFEYCGKLFTDEFIELISNILNDDGMFLTWYYRHNKNENYLKISKSYYNSLKKVFMNVDYAELVESLNKDTYFFASNKYQVKNNKSLVSEILVKNG